MLSLFVIISLAGTPHKVSDIATPQGYTRIQQGETSLGTWLRHMQLKAGNTVYLYNGQQKANQSAQYAVLDISTGKKDLQQCADAVMRLYAEYLHSTAQYQRIAFHATDGTLMDYSSWRQGYRFVLKNGKLVKQMKAAACNTRACFDQYLETVFAYAGTLSLSRELQPVTDVQPGDVFIQGGSPGHAVMVMDVAVNNKGEKMFLLAQSYMPAQDMHILRNPSSSPWYKADLAKELVTPEWTFPPHSLKRFK